MLNIVIPMAGAGSRFTNAGYTIPKPLIPIHGKPMIEVVIRNLTPKQAHRFIFICQSQHEKTYNLKQQLTQWAPNCEVMLLDGVTDGAACTVLKAKHLIDNNEPLMIANSDQFVDIDINDYLQQASNPNVSGLIMTMFADDPKWSFAAVDTDGFVTEVAEKRAISNEATVGIYNFAQGSDFVQAAEGMIERGLTVNSEYYVAPTYNQLIEQGKKIVIYNVGKDRAGMYGLGTPSDLDYFLSEAVV